MGRVRGTNERAMMVLRPAAMVEVVYCVRLESFGCGLVFAGFR